MAIVHKKPVFPDVPEWPEAKAEPSPAHIGHNKPPLEEIIPEEFRAELLRHRPDFLTRLDQSVDAADRAEAVDDESLGRCGDLVKLYRTIIQHVEETHKAVKQPYLDSGRLVDAEKNSLLTKVSAAKQKVESIGNAFVAKRKREIEAENARIAAIQRAAAERAAAADRAREQAEQKAERAAAAATNDAERKAAADMAEAAAQAAKESMSDAALAPSAPTKVEPVRSDSGATVSSKQEHKSEVIDYTLAFIAVEDNAKVREAIDKAVAGLVRAGKRKIEGVRIWPVAKANYR